MRWVSRTGRSSRSGIGGLLLLICWNLGCGSSEPATPKASTSSEPRIEGPGRELPPEPDPESDRLAAPIPPLVGAVRPTESPLVAILDEKLPPVVDPPKLELPSLGQELKAETSGQSAVPPALDLDQLNARLRETDALGVFTKLSLKNQIDDLLAEFGRFHKKGRGRLEKLRWRYDSLVLKIISLVQDEEPRLASDIGRSRESIWVLLADPEGFAELAEGKLS